jgi:hypothetical protein
MKFLAFVVHVDHGLVLEGSAALEGGVDLFFEEF